MKVGGKFKAARPLAIAGQARCPWKYLALKRHVHTGTGMALPGEAALAMGWDIALLRAEFEHRHAHEHFPECLAVPGMRRALRCRLAQGGADLRAGLRALPDTLMQRPGRVGLHRLRRATQKIAQAEKQKIRG